MWTCKIVQKLENPPGHNDSRACAALTVIINSLPQCAQCSAQVLGKTNPLVMKIPVLRLENKQAHYSCCTGYPHQLKLTSKEMDVWLVQKYLQNLSHSPWTQDADIYLQLPETCFGWFTHIIISACLFTITILQLCTVVLHILQQKYFA